MGNGRVGPDKRFECNHITRHIQILFSVRPNFCRSTLYLSLNTLMLFKILLVFCCHYTIEVSNSSIKRWSMIRAFESAKRMYSSRALLSAHPWTLRMHPTMQPVLCLPLLQWIRMGWLDGSVVQMQFQTHQPTTTTRVKYTNKHIRVRNISLAYPWRIELLSMHSLLESV